MKQNGGVGVKHVLVEIIWLQCKFRVVEKNYCKALLDTILHILNHHKLMQYTLKADNSLDLERPLIYIKYFANTLNGNVSLTYTKILFSRRMFQKLCFLTHYVRNAATDRIRTYRSLAFHQSELRSIARYLVEREYLQSLQN